LPESKRSLYSEARAASRTRWMFQPVNRFASERRGLRSRLARLYIYKWFGEPPGARFDAGLLNFDGSPRAAYFVVRRFARAHR
jgi:hypothetical protein